MGVSYSVPYIKRYLLYIDSMRNRDRAVTDVEQPMGGLTHSRFTAEALGDNTQCGGWRSTECGTDTVWVTISEVEGTTLLCVDDAVGDK